MDEPLKLCLHCDVLRPRSGKWRKGRCPECWAKKRYQGWIKSQYGLNPEALELLRAKQNNSCAICGQGFEGTQLHVDHDHDTGAVRGLLCVSCNTGLGRFEDNPDRLISAVFYLAQSRGLKVGDSLGFHR